MALKTLFLIITLGYIAAMFFFVALEREKTNNLLQARSQVKTSPTIKFEKNASIYFSPSVIAATSSAQVIETDLILSSNINPVNRVQIELQFDPNVVENIIITEPKDYFFGNLQEYKISFKSVDYQNGRISYAIESYDEKNKKTGTGKIGRISFSIKKTATSENGISQIKVLDKTSVFTPYFSESILEAFNPLTIENIKSRVSQMPSIPATPKQNQ